VTLGVALNAIAGIAVALGPYLPFTSPLVFEMLGLAPEQHWHRPVVAAGTQLGPVAPLFAKVDAEMLDAD